MNARKIWLVFVITLTLSLLFLFIYFGSVPGDMRFIGGILTFLLTFTFLLIIMTYLFKMEAPVKKVNMSNRYTDISFLELEKSGINSIKYKSLIFEKFKTVHDAFSNYDLDALKSNLTLDLYNHYLEQLKIFKSLNRKIVMRDFELVDIKIYDFDPKLNNFKAYLNVKMYDYMLDLDTSKCIDGSDKKKKSLEFEIDLELRTEVNGLYNQYVIARKKCINDMDYDRKK